MTSSKLTVYRVQTPRGHVDFFRNVDGFDDAWRANVPGHSVRGTLLSHAIGDVLPFFRNVASRRNYEPIELSVDEAVAMTGESDRERLREVLTRQPAV